MEENASVEEVLRVDPDALAGTTANPPVEPIEATETTQPVILPPEVNIPPRPETSPQVTQSTTADIDSAVQSTVLDDLDERIFDAIHEVTEDASETIPSPIYGGQRDNMFVVSIDGQPVPVRFTISMDAGLYIESRNEYPLVVREYINQVGRQLATKADELAKHMQMRLLTQLKEEIVTQSLKDVLKIAGITDEEVVALHTSGQFDAIVKETLRLMQVRQEEAYREDHPLEEPSAPQNDTPVTPLAVAREDGSIEVGMSPQEPSEQSAQEVETDLQAEADFPLETTRSMQDTLEHPPGVPVARPELPVVGLAEGEVDTVVVSDEPPPADSHPEYPGPEVEIPVPDSVSISAQGEEEPIPF